MKKKILLIISLLLVISAGTVFALSTTKNAQPESTQLTEANPPNEPERTESEEVNSSEQAISNKIEPAPTATPVSASITASTPAAVQKPTTAPKSSPAHPPAPQPKVNTQMSAEKQRMLDLINAERAKVGAPPLVADVKVIEVSQIKSDDMVKNNYFSHTSPTYGTPFDMLRKFGVSFSGAAENIALNTSVEAAHAALMASEGHRKNILNPSYNYIGIGITDGPKGKVIAQMFIKK